jgi:hypothetical protein
LWISQVHFGIGRRNRLIRLKDDRERIAVSVDWRDPALGTLLPRAA